MGKKIAEQQKAIKEQRRNVAPEIKVQSYDKGVWERDSDLIQLRHQVNDSFRATWKEGIEHYISGDWNKARSVFKLTLTGTPNNDGPSRFLLDMMDKLGGADGSAPADWKGYRLD